MSGNTEKISEQALEISNSIPNSSELALRRVLKLLIKDRDELESLLRDVVYLIIKVEEELNERK